NTTCPWARSSSPAMGPYSVTRCVWRSANDRSVASAGPGRDSTSASNIAWTRVSLVARTDCAWYIRVSTVRSRIGWVRRGGGAVALAANAAQDGGDEAGTFAGGGDEPVGD